MAEGFCMDGKLLNPEVRVGFQKETRHVFESDLLMDFQTAIFGSHESHKSKPDSKEEKPTNATEAPSPSTSLLLTVLKKEAGNRACHTACNDGTVGLQPCHHLCLCHVLFHAPWQTGAGENSFAHTRIQSSQHNPQGPQWSALQFPSKLLAIQTSTNKTRMATHCDIPLFTGSSMLTNLPVETLTGL